MPATEQIELVVSTKAALSAMKELNAGITSTEKGVEGANDKLQASYDKLEKFLVQSTDRNVKALNRQIDAIDRETAAFNKTPIERLIAARDRHIQKIQQTGVALSEQTLAIERVNISYAKMIALETTATAGATGSTRQVIALEKAFESGSLASNRAAASFLLSIKGLGPAIAGAFAVFGAVAFLGVIVQVGEAVHKFFKEMNEAPRRIKTEFEDLFSSSVKTNDAIELTNVKLANQIAKLEHKPQNLVREALLEAKAAADDLAESLQKDNEQIVKFLEKNEHGFGGSFMGYAPTTELTADAKKYQSKLVDIRYNLSSGMTTDDKTGKTSPYTPEMAVADERAATAARRKQLQSGITETQRDIKGSLQGTQLTTTESTFYDKMQYQKYALSLLGTQDTKIDNSKETARLKDESARATAHKTASDFTEKLRQEVSKAQEGELNGLEKINSAYTERIRHMKEEGQFNTTNLKLTEQIRDAELARFAKAEARAISNAGYGASQSVAAAQIKQQESINSATNKANGEDVSPESINSDYNKALAADDKVFQSAARHIQELRDMNADAGTIRIAQIEASKVYALAALDAETRKIVELIDLEKKRQDEKDKAAKADYDNNRKIEDAQLSFEQRASSATSQYRIRLRKALGHTNVGGEKANIAADEQDRVSTAMEQYGNTAEVLRRKEEALQETYKGKLSPDQQIAKQKELTTLTVEGLKATADTQAEIDAAHREYTIETINLWNKQYDEIKGKTEGLLHTAFTNPSAFGGQLRTTVRDAALKPIEDKLSSVISTQINTMIHGGKPTEKMSDLKGIGKNGEGDGLTVWVKNMGPAGTPAMSKGNGGAGSMLQQLINLPTRGSSFNMFPGGQYFPGGGGSGGTPAGVSSTSINYGQGAQDFNSQVFGGSDGTGGSGGGYSGSGGFYGGGGGGEGGPGVLGGFASQIMGGGFQKGKGGFMPANMLKNLKKTDWGFGKTTDEDGKTLGPGRHGVAGAAIMAGGMALAQDGLMGKRAGTTLGIFEGAAGGAMIGFEYGGPLGAAIGGAVGAGIGIGEKVAGVESKQAEAKRLIKQLYHVDIDGSTQDQVVQVAKSKYGGKVSLAVRDPEIRKMLELYAAATGQNMAQSATTPHGGSLSQAGGTLSQDASYRYGKAYSFQSNLPISGGYQTTQYPNSNQPMSLSIAVNGKGAGDFMTGVVSPEFVNAQWISAANGSKNRVQNSAMAYNPGLIVG